MNFFSTFRLAHARGRLVVALTTLGALVGAIAPSATVHAADTITGAGSTWSQIAIDQWRADVARQGLTVNYQGVGSTSGRVFYYNGQVDFGVSEIPFNNDGGVDEIALAAGRPYAYMPIVAGGTAFMYNLKIAGKQVRNLRLSPTALAKIFTGVITNWNDPVIKVDNPGLSLPSLAIKPVVRSDGSGTSAQFTAFMKAVTPTEWNAFCIKTGLGDPCPPTSLYPIPPGAGFAAQQFSDGVANFVAAPYNNGAITYVEYGYAKERGFPVASVKNKAGKYAQPLARNVAIALQGARLNPDGTQILSGVYNYNDPDAYPVSSYSYMIVPTSTASGFTTGKGESLSKFIVYFVCAGQQKSEQLGYSPLPKVLVEAAFKAMAKIPGSVAAPALKNCSNPAVNGSFLSGGGDTTTDTTETGTGSSSGSDSGAGAGAGTGTQTGTGTDSGIGTGTDTVDGTDSGAGAGVGSGGTASAVPLSVPPRTNTASPVVYLLILLSVAALIAGPPYMMSYLKSRKPEDTA